MAEVEQVTVSLPDEIATEVKEAVSDGDYTSASEIVREALYDWKLKRTAQAEAFAALKAAIDAGRADVVASRVETFSAEAISDQGRKLLAARRTSA